MPVLIPFNENDLPLSIIHEYRINTQSRIIYTTVIISVILAFLSLLFINIPVSVISTGVIDAGSAQFENFVPVNGLMQNAKFPESGYSVADQRISDLPSDDGLKAYSYVSPSDIDMIKVGQQVSFKVDGFDSNSWGTLAGKVVEISEDLVLHAKDPPVFKVHCSLDKDHFELNGAKVYLKKGMRFTSRFNIGDRNLFQLFFSTSDRAIGTGFDKQRQN